MTSDSEGTAMRYARVRRGVNETGIVCIEAGTNFAVPLDLACPVVHGPLAFDPPPNG